MPSTTRQKILWNEKIERIQNRINDLVERIRTVEGPDSELAKSVEAASRCLNEPWRETASKTALRDAA